MKPHQDHHGHNGHHGHNHNGHNGHNTGHGHNHNGHVTTKKKDEVITTSNNNNSNNNSNNCNNQTDKLQDNRLDDALTVLRPSTRTTSTRNSPSVTKQPPQPRSLIVKLRLRGGHMYELCDAFEVCEFIGYLALMIATWIAGISLWVCFFTRIFNNNNSQQHLNSNNSNSSSSFGEDGRYVMTCVAWTLGLTCTLHLRAYIRQHVEFRPMYDHGEVFMGMSLVAVFGVNLAFYLHRPAPEPLFDLGFMLMPELSLESPLRSLSDIMTLVLPIGAGVQTALLTREHRIRVFMSYFRLMTVGYALRTLTVSLTSLPGPAPHCRLQSSSSPSSVEPAYLHPPLNWRDIVTRIGPMQGKFTTCGDLIFSGHMCLLNTALLLYLRQLDRYLSRTGRRVRWMCGALYLATVAMLCIASRKHYTVDIVLGILISTLSFFHFEHSWWRPHPVSPQEDETQDEKVLLDEWSVVKPERDEDGGCHRCFEDHDQDSSFIC